MKFKVGDAITLVDETGIYTITNILSKNEFEVEDKHGFDRICKLEEITIYKKNAFDNVEIETFENKDIQINPFSKQDKKTGKIPTIDLHIEHLLDSHGHMTNHQIVLYQLDVCKRLLDKHIENGTKQLIIIHGVGKGKLKEEVRYLLQSYSFIDFMDDQYSAKGMGATKIYVNN